MHIYTIGDLSVVVLLLLQGVILGGFGGSFGGSWHSSAVFFPCDAAVALSACSPCHEMDLRSVHVRTGLHFCMSDSCVPACLHVCMCACLHEQHR